MAPLSGLGPLKSRCVGPCYPGYMAQTLLRTLLTTQPARAPLILDALRSGELDARLALAEDPGLLVAAIKAMSSSEVSRHEPSEQIRLELVQALEALGADPWRRDAEGLDAFDYALGARSPLIATHLGTRPDAPDSLASRRLTGNAHPLLAATTERETAALLELGFDLHTRDRGGNTLLHNARDPAQVSLLLARGLDPETLNDKGQTVRQAWDERTMVLSERQALEATLAQAAPLDPEAVAREFARDLVSVGLTRARERLSEAGVDPRRTRPDGLSLTEQVIAESLRRCMRMPRSSGFSHTNLGDPVSHRKWRRAVLATLKLCGQLDDQEQLASVNPDALRPALWLFRHLDRHLAKPDPTPTPTKAQRRAGKAPVPVAWTHC